MTRTIAWDRLVTRVISDDLTRLKFCPGLFEAIKLLHAQCEIATRNGSFLAEQCTFMKTYGMILSLLIICAANHLSDGFVGKVPVITFFMIVNHWQLDTMTWTKCRLFANSSLIYIFANGNNVFWRIIRRMFFSILSICTAYGSAPNKQQGIFTRTNGDQT